MLLDGQESTSEESEARSHSEARSEGSDTGEEASEKRPGIFVRINPAAKKVLERAATGSIPETRSMPYARVIERLLEYFEKQGEDLQGKILRGIYIDPLRESEDMLARLHRAQHAFENERYYYAVQTYKVIADNLRTSGSSKELLEVCNYRLGHCWIRLSYDLRLDALSALSPDLDSDLSHEDRKAKCVKLFEEAGQALDAALSYLAQVNSDVDTLTKLVSHYNKACCHSLKAQYIVESKLDGKSLSDLRKAWESRNHQRMVELWKFIGDTWRKNDNDPRPDNEAKEALSALQKVYSTWEGGSNESSLSSGGSWLVGISYDDVDLFFVRSDEKYRPKFDEWRTKAHPGDHSIARSLGVTDLLKSTLQELGLPS
jgi:hypothetical protein